METVEERQAFRQQIAAEQNALVEAARQLLGPALAYGKWILHDNTGVEPDRVAYCCRTEDQVGWQPSADKCFGETRNERLPDRYVEAKCERFYLMRYQLWFGILEEYHPMDPQVLAKRNEARIRNKEEKRLAKERKRMPLFADQIEK